jgi:solute carrier family 6 amino acid/orphan transporter-like 15/16/17/18/20
MNTTAIITECDLSSETQYFWYRTALGISDGIGDFGGIRYWMLLCLIFAWVIIFFIIMKGVQSSGKVVYFTALFPYVVMTIFFIRGNITNYFLQMDFCFRFEFSNQSIPLECLKDVKIDVLF